MKYYVKNSLLKYTIQSDAPELAARQAIIFWKSKYPNRVLSNITRVSEIGFDVNNDYHDKDIVYSTSHLKSKIN